MSIEQIVTAVISLISAVGISTFIRPVRQEDVLKTELEVLAASADYPEIHSEIRKVAGARARSMSKIPGWLEIGAAWVLALVFLVVGVILSTKISVEANSSGAIGTFSVGFMAGTIGSFTAGAWLGFWGWARFVERGKKKS